ncbi:MAG: DUF6504 family protein [Chloroflexota bacterium]
MLVGSEVTSGHLEPVAVECHSGYRYGQRPVAVCWRGERREVIKVERAWRSKGALASNAISHHFRVRLAGGELVDLVYDEAGDRWWVRAR